MKTVWFKDPVIAAKLTLLWNKGVLTKDMAANLNKEFKTRITASMIRGKVHTLGLTPRAKRGPNKPRQKPVEEPVKQVYSKPSMPKLPQSKFFDAPADKSFALI